MKRIVVACPGASQTGGPEALHQLAFEINAVSPGSAKIHYFGPRDVRINAWYLARYPLECTADESELRDSILILPEAENPLVWRPFAPVCIWSWFLSEVMPHGVVAYSGCGILAQSLHAATLFGLRGGPRNGATDVRMVSDYVSLEAGLIPGEVPIKSRCVAVNGVRNAVFASALTRNYGMTVRFIAAMSHDEALSAIKGADIYIDFGWHPGKDRGPREAALLGCVVITNRHGTASSADVPLPDFYKMEDMHPSQVVEKVRQIRSDIALHVFSQEPYRVWIRQERQRFHAEVRAFVADPLVGKGLEVPKESVDMIDFYRHSANSRLQQLISMNVIYRGDFLPREMTVAARLLMPVVRMLSKILVKIADFTK